MSRHRLDKVALPKATRKKAAELKVPLSSLVQESENFYAELLYHRLVSHTLSHTPAYISNGHREAITILYVRRTLTFWGTAWRPRRSQFAPAPSPWSWSGANTGNPGSRWWYHQWATHCHTESSAGLRQARQVKCMGDEGYLRVDEGAQLGVDTLCAAQVAPGLQVLVVHHFSRGSEINLQHNTRNTHHK